MSPSLGVVVIGRNEGARLIRCMESLAAAPGLPQLPVVYVDSGSSDDSIAVARDLGAATLELDPSQPFTAARGRNAGLAELLRLHPATELVQFVDGDCEVQPGWLPRAMAFLAQEPRVGVVCGRRRERYPDASPYNRLADMEWDTPVGPAAACGGDALMRVDAVRAAGGYDAGLIAGEDPELCYRIRRQGWDIVRLDEEMTLHDAAMSDFGQWWRRAVRAGHSYAARAALHGRGPERLGVRAVVSVLAWALALPLAALIALPATAGASLLLLGGYGVLWWRVRSHRLGVGEARDHAALYATATVVGKFAELLGVLDFAWDRLRGRRTELIEYK